MSFRDYCLEYKGERLPEGEVREYRFDCDICDLHAVAVYPRTLYYASKFLIEDHTIQEAEWEFGKAGCTHNQVVTEGIR